MPQDIDDFLADNPQPPPNAPAAAATDADVNTTKAPDAAAADPPVSPRPGDAAGGGEWGQPPAAKERANGAAANTKEWQSRQNGMSMAARSSSNGGALTQEEVRQKLGWCPPPPPPPPPLKKARVNLFDCLERALARKCDALDTSVEDAYDEWDAVVQTNLRMLWAAHDTNRDGALGPAELRRFVEEMVTAQNRLVALRMAARYAKAKAAKAKAAEGEGVGEGGGEGEAQTVDVEKVLAAAMADFDASGEATRVVEEIMASADANGDGKLSLPEMMRYFEPPPPPPPPKHVRHAHADLFARFARAIEQKGEKLGSGAGGNGGNGLFAMDRNWTEALNANVVAIWANYDTDKSGYLDQGEMRTMLGEMLRAQEKMFYGKLEAQASAAEDDESGKARAGTHMSAFAAAVDEMSKDGALDKLLDDALAAADTDGDGKISLPELRAYFGAVLPGSNSLLSRAQEKVLDRVRAAVAQAGERKGRTGALELDADWRRSLHANAAMVWGLFDADRSGGLEREELTRLCRLVFAEQQQLLKARVRGAGVMDAADVDAAVDAAVKAFTDSGELDALVDDLLKRADRNGDGKIDPRELKHYFFLQTHPARKKAAPPPKAPPRPAAAAEPVSTGSGPL